MAERTPLEVIAPMPVRCPQGEPVRLEHLAVGQVWRGRSTPRRTIVEIMPREPGSRRLWVRYQVAHERGPRPDLVTGESFAKWAVELVRQDDGHA